MELMDCELMDTVNGYLENKRNGILMRCLICYSSFHQDELEMNKNQSDDGLLGNPENVRDTLELLKMLKPQLTIPLEEDQVELDGVSLEIKDSLTQLPPKSSSCLCQICGVAYTQYLLKQEEIIRLRKEVSELQQKFIAALHDSLVMMSTTTTEEDSNMVAEIKSEEGQDFSYNLEESIQNCERQLTLIKHIDNVRRFLLGEDYHPPEEVVDDKKPEDNSAARPHACEYCGKGFTRKSDLNRHLRLRFRKGHCHRKKVLQNFNPDNGVNLNKNRDHRRRTDSGGPELVDDDAHSMPDSPRSASSEMEMSYKPSNSEEVEEEQDPLEISQASRTRESSLDLIKKEQEKRREEYKRRVERAKKLFPNLKTKQALKAYTKHRSAEMKKKEEKNKNQQDSFPDMEKMSHKPSNSDKEEEKPPPEISEASRSQSEASTNNTEPMYELIRQEQEKRREEYRKRVEKAKNFFPDLKTKDALTAYTRQRSAEMKKKVVKNEQYSFRDVELKRNAEGRFLCPFGCQKYTYGQRKPLIRHINLSHIDLSEKKHACDQCDSKFYYSHDLIRHFQQKHGGGYQCDICGVSITDSSSLRRHKRGHSGLKPYVCEQCGKCFKLKGNLETHSRFHSGEKPFTCHVCGQAFKWQNSLTHHLNTRHLEEATEIKHEATTTTTTTTTIRSSGSKKKKKRAKIKKGGELTEVVMMQ